jgi:hypothetical protein
MFSLFEGHLNKFKYLRDRFRRHLSRLSRLARSMR